MNLGDITRRHFVGGMALTAAGLMVPSAFAQKTIGNVKIIPVIPDMTANLVMDYIAHQAGVDLGRQVTDDARKYLTVELGPKSPRTVWVGTNLDNVVLSDQIAWRVTEAGVKPFSHKMKVERTPDMIDYLFPGDTLVLDLDKMPEADMRKFYDRFPNPRISITRPELADFAHVTYGARVEAQKGSIIKLPGIDRARVERYVNMDELAFMVREVPKGVGDVMYKPLVNEGVNFQSPVEYVAKSQAPVAVAIVGPNARDDVTAMQIYFVIEARDTVSGRNVAIGKANSELDARFKDKVGDFEAVVGGEQYKTIVGKAVSGERRYDRPSNDRIGYAEVLARLRPHIELFNRIEGNVTPVDALALLDQGKYRVEAVFAQAFKPTG